MDSKTSPPRKQRADAQQNVADILEAARTVFAERGYGASIEEIGRRAGVGAGTLYRHFGNKSALVEQVATEVMRKTLQEITAAHHEENGSWEAFARVMRFMVRYRSSQLFPVSRGRATVPGPELLAIRSQLLSAFDDLVLRTQQAGSIRADVNANDLVLFLNSLPPHLSTPGVDTDLADLASRHLGVLLDGLRCPTGQELTLPAPGRREIDLYYHVTLGL